ncbi:MAG: beta-carotene hydroxylase, partial [Brevundimonas sp.]|nr:beta-carotene hydroxylase [Brevundimonas sp.]
MAKADQTAYAGAMAWLTWIALFLTAFLGMEAFAWIMHRYVMHG